MSGNMVRSAWLSSASIDDLLEEEIALKQEIDTISEQLNKAKADPDSRSLKWYFRALEAIRVKNLQSGAVKKKITMHENEQRHRFNLDQKYEHFRREEERKDLKHKRKIELLERHDRIIIDQIVSSIEKEEFLRIIDPISEDLKSIKKSL